MAFRPDGAKPLSGILLIGPLGTNFSEILIEIHISSFKKTHLKMSSAKCRPSGLGLNVIILVSKRGQSSPYHGLPHWLHTWRPMFCRQHFANAFSRMKNVFWIILHWCVFLRGQLTVFSIGSGNGLFLFGNKPLFDSVKTMINNCIWHSQATVI